MVEMTDRGPARVLGGKDLKTRIMAMPAIERLFHDVDVDAWD